MNAVFLFLHNANLRAERKDQSVDIDIVNVVEVFNAADCEWCIMVMVDLFEVSTRSERGARCESLTPIA